MASESNEENSSMKNSVTESEKGEERHGNKEESSKNRKEEKDQKNESDEESESDENEEMMGLLDRPVEITGCRARKQVERLEYNVSVTKDKHDIPEGTGQKLGDCPRIEQHIQKTTSSDLKALHRILFGRAGSANEIKKNIRKFSGFTFTKNSTEFEHKKSLMEKLTTSVLKNVCEIIDIERSGYKEDLIMRILEFLLNPKESGKRVVSKKKTSNKEKKKNSDKKIKNKKPRSKKTSSENAESSSEESGKSESEKEDNDNDKKMKVSSKPEKSKAKKDEKAKDKKVSKGTKRKQDTESSEEEPVSKKTKEPSDEDIKNLIKKILDNADLHEITMKKVIKQVGEHYPQIDLSQKKPFIKETIKSVIS